MHTQVDIGLILSVLMYEMNYPEYFKKCRSNFHDESKPSLEDFYNNPVHIIPRDRFNISYMSAVYKLSQCVKKDLDKEEQAGIMINHPNFWKFEEQVKTICDYLVPHLEKHVFGCNLYVDKVYIYRTCECERSSSYLWHYDNNPQEVVKTIIYLNDVNLDNSPFEYLVNEKGQGVLAKSTRIGPGPNEWISPPNQSRITDKEMINMLAMDYKNKLLLGKMGTTCAFSNDAIHRANPVIKGYRDVINIRVKPTLNKVNSYLDKKHTTSFETSGSVNPNPEAR